MEYLKDRQKKTCKTKFRRKIFRAETPMKRM